jgi:hypothetical protein
MSKFCLLQHTLLDFGSDSWDLAKRAVVQCTVLCLDALVKRHGWEKVTLVIWAVELGV